MKMENNHMSEGTGEDSYARNSLIQAYSIAKVFPTIRDALEGFYSTRLPKCVMAAELGCASGPNTLMLIPELIDITYKAYRANENWQGNNNNNNVPQIKVFLNDLPANDFNTISRSLADLDKQLEKDREGDIGPYFISTTPGSYYKRIFPTNFLHFVHTSNSAHWLSQVPKGLVKENGEFVNKGNIYISETSPPEVIAAYREQFQQDFTLFLGCRAKEIVAGGRMVVNIMVSTETHRPQDFFMTKVLNMALQSMAREGLIDGKKLDEFEIPWYPPTTEEVKKLIEDEGSFRLHKHEIFSVEWDLPNEALGIKNNGEYKNNDNNNHENNDLWVRAKFAAGPVKTGSEYMIATQFGEHVIEELYSRVTELIAKQLVLGKLETFHQAISLIKI